jgi:hypothetical protein
MYIGRHRIYAYCFNTNERDDLYTSVNCSTSVLKDKKNATKCLYGHLLLTNFYDAWFKDMLI